MAGIVACIFQLRQPYKWINLEIKISTNQSGDLLVCIGMVLGCTMGLAGCQEAVTERRPAPPAAVTVSEPRLEKIVEWNEYTGRLESANFVEIRSRVGGYLEAVEFDEGQNVKKGTLLFVIDRRPFEAELTGARASLEEANAQLTRSKAQMAQANAVKSTSASQMSLAKADYDRSLELGNALSQSERDAARNEFLKAQAAMESADAGIALADADIARATAAIATAEAVVSTAELNLNYTQIRAPIDGRISRKYVTEGNLISGGSEQSTLLTTIVSLDPIFFVFDASEQQVLRFQRMVQEGTRRSVQEVRYPAFLALADETGYPHRGYIDFVDNQFDPNTATLLARAVFTNEDNSLIPGLFARVRLANTLEYEAMLLPDEAIVADQAQRFVFVVGPDNQIIRKVIETGPLALGLRVIRKGIDPEDRVVISGVQRVRPGVVVEPNPTSIEVSERDMNDYDSAPVEKDQ